MRTHQSYSFRLPGLFGVSSFGLLLAGVVGGCSAGPEPTASDNVDSTTDELSLPTLCGGPSARTCAADRFCLTLPGSCPGPTVIGLCVTKPGTCPSTSSPVCGCNGRTYTNSCKASQAGTGVAKAGACPPPVDPCANIACKAGQMCVAQSDGTAACVPDPCFNLVCKGAQICVAEPDGTAACVDDPCANIACKNGQTCVVLPDGTAGCQ